MARILFYDCLVVRKYTWRFNNQNLDTHAPNETLRDGTTTLLLFFMPRQSLNRQCIEKVYI